MNIVKYIKLNKLTNDLVNLADQECDLRNNAPVLLTIYLKHTEDYHLFLPQNLANIIDNKMKGIDTNNIGSQECSLTFNKNRNNPDELSYTILDSQIETDLIILEEMAVNYDIFRETLFYLFYYYPNVDVVDEQNISYFTKEVDFDELIRLYKKFKGPDYHNYINEYTIRIENRINFWRES